METKKRKARIRAKHGKHYTPEEIEFVKRWYGRKPVARIAKSLQRSEYSIQHVVRYYGFKTKKRREWTTQELTQLRRLWGTKTAQEIADIIGRSEGCLKSKAYSLKLGKERKVALDEQGRRISLATSIAIAWSPQMIADLLRMYPQTKNDELAEFFGISKKTVIRKAKSMGLNKTAEFTRAVSQEGLRRARLTNLTRGNKGQFKQGERATPGSEFGAPNGNKTYWQIQRDGIQSTRISEESNQVC